MLANKISDKLDAIVESVRPKILDFAKIEKPCVVEPNADNSELHYYCYNCKSEGDAPLSTSVCPKCGAKMELYQPEQHAVVTYFQKTEEGFNVVKTEIGFFFAIDTSDITMKFSICIYDGNLMNFYEQEADGWVKRRPNHDYRWYGFRDNRFYNLDATERSNFMKEFPNVFKINAQTQSAANYICKDSTDVMYELYEINKELKKEKKKNKKKDVYSFEISTPKEEDFSRFSPDTTTFTYKTEGFQTVITCDKCGAKIIQPKLNQYQYERIDFCPKCERPAATGGDNYYYHFNEIDDGLLISLYLRAKVSSTNISGNRTEETRIKMMGAVLFDTEGTIKFFQREGAEDAYRSEWKNDEGVITLIQVPCSAINKDLQRVKGNYYNHQLTQSKEEIIPLLKKYNVNHCGVVSIASGQPIDPYTELEKVSMEDFTNFIFEMMSYCNIMSIHNSFPGIELFAKCGMSNMVNDFNARLSIPAFLNKKETSPAKILGVSPSDFRSIRTKNAGLEQFTRFNQIREIDKNATFEDCDSVLSRGYAQNIMTLCMDILNIGLSKVNMATIRHYLDSLDDYQCITANEGLMLWRDYLNMSQEIHVNLNDRTALFPNSLKLEHDRVVRKSDSMRNKQSEKNFKEAVEKYKFLEYSNEKFLVKVPDSQEELFEEGRVLHHCVGSYVRTISNGSTFILFIRSQEAPDAPLCTVEVRNSHIIQARTRFNQPAASVPGVAKFMREWRLEKKLV